MSKLNSLRPNQSSIESVYKQTTYIDGQSSTQSKLKRYQNEFKHLLPYRNDHDIDKDKPTEYAAEVDYVNCLQYIFFTWMTPVVRKIFNSQLQLTDINTCSKYDNCQRNTIRFKTFWEKHRDHYGLHNISLSWVLFSFIRTRFLVSCFFYIMCLVSGYLSSTFFVKKLLEEVERNVASISLSDNATDSDLEYSVSYHETFKWTIALFLCELFRAISFSIMFAITIRTCIRTVNALNGAIYDKIMSKLNSNTDRSQSIQPSNLFANDLWKVYQMIYMAPLMIGSPIIILVTIFYTIYLIGSSAILGLILFVLMFVLQFFLTKQQTFLRTRIMQQTDNRISLITQLMKFIRTIKFNAWDEVFQKDIEYCRQAESTIILRYQYIQCLSTSMALLTPMLITIINILFHTLLGNDITVSTAFSLVMLNYIAAHGIRSLPNYLREIVNGRIALKRIERFLRVNDQVNYVRNKMIDENNAVELVDASFSWTDCSVNESEQLCKSFKLENFNLMITKKSNLCLYGPVGSGKTALLLSIMGQTQCFNGQVNVFSDRIAYVSQNAWLQNCSIKDNILFGAPFDKRLYFETMQKCSLLEDISQLSNGDDTIVGENGVQLSGGQKQRIALARAVYADSDIYLLDDLFSSLDSRVAKSIFTDVIQGLLKHKTVIFVLRHLYLLTDNDNVALINNGKISQIGSHSDLLQNSEEYKDLVEQSKTVSTEQTQINSEDSQTKNPKSEELLDASNQDSDDELFDYENSNIFSKNSSKPPKITRTNTRNDSYASLVSLMAHFDNTLQESDEFIDVENNLTEKKYQKYLKRYLKPNKSNKAFNANATNAISMSTYYDYVKASGGWGLFSVMILVFALQTATSTFSNWWLSFWLNQGGGQIANSTVVSQSILDNPNLHLYQSIYFVSFFIVIVTSLVMGIFFARIILKASNNLHSQTLKKVIKSPMAFFDSIKLGKIVNLFSHNIDELDNQLPVSLDGFLQRVLLVLGNFLIIIFTLYWFSILFIFFIVVFFIVFRLYRKAMYWLKQADMRNRSPIYSFVNTTIDGLSTIKAFQLESQFQSKFHELCDRHIAANFLSQCAVRWLSIRIDFLCVFSSVAICMLALFNLQTIGPAYAGLVITQSLQLSGLLQLVIRLALDLETKLVSVERVQAYIRLLKTEKSIVKTQTSKEDLLKWPEEGLVCFRDVDLRYRKNLPFALRQVSFEVQTGKKFAIVGRTGAGKSSITYAMFRMVETDSGSITIDNIDIQTIPLKVLRSKLSIIPQDPVLFKGTVRKNLDPWLRCKDDELIDVINQVKLDAKLKTFPNGLNEIAHDNKFSTGEKQLLCMARALLRKSQIIVFDEATSSVDDQTEKNIWEIIQNNFGSCTVIMIAHRLQTVLNCDEVIVMKKGQVVECGNPNELMKDPKQSLFGRMVSKS